MRYITFIVVVLLFSACQQTTETEQEHSTAYQEKLKDPELFHRSMKQLTDVIVHDIFSPPVASRIYTYPSIAAYEVMVNAEPSYRSLEGQLTDLKNVPKPDPNLEYAFPLASLQAFLTVGKALIFSEEKMEKYERILKEEIMAHDIPEEVFERSVAYGNEMASHILKWSGGDNYKKTRTYPKYAINYSDDPGKWQPTPPSYMDGIEPHWREIRTMVIDSASQFTPPPPTAFSIDKNSKFYKETMEVYMALQEDEKEERTAIAQFWDCNPYTSHTHGHVMYATKKITPGGHWIGITKLACEKDSADFMKTIQAYTLTSIALFDAFISCWDEKYRSNLVRPETYINKYIDEDWYPTLQTPPFPEHTSGHSVISRASAVVLTDLFGDNFAFDDSTEVEYGLPVRSFNSFIEASEEAAISRLYGGIHYRPAIDYGVAQGEKVGNFILQELDMKAQMGQK